MSPIDDELRRVLDRRADDLVPAPDLLTGVTGTARRIRHRRRMATGVAGVAVVAAVAVAVPAVLTSTGSGPARIAGPATTAPSRLLGWPLQGDAGVAQAHRDYLVQHWADAHSTNPDAVSWAPLYALAGPTGDVVIAQLSAPGGPAHTVMAFSGQDSTQIDYDQPTPTDTDQVSGVLPDVASDGVAVYLVIRPGNADRPAMFRAGQVLTGETILPIDVPSGSTAIPASATAPRLRLVDTTAMSGYLMSGYLGPVTYDGNVTAQPRPPVSAPPVSSSPAPTSSAAPTRTPAAGTSPGLCTTNELTVSLGRVEGAAGSTYLTVLLRNTSSAACRLNGHPGIAWVAGSGHSQVGGTAVRSGQPLHAVTLAPGATASAVVQQPEPGDYAPGDCRPTPVDGLQVIVPDTTDLLVLPHPATVCAGPDTGRPTVSVVQAGTSPTLDGA